MGGIQKGFRNAKLCLGATMQEFMLSDMPVQDMWEYSSHLPCRPQV